MLMIIFFVDQNLKNLPLSKILDIEKLNNVDQTIEVANGLPNECYINNDYLAHEREKVFYNKWTVIGVASSIPHPGDAKPYNLLGIPLILLRDKDMKIRVFHNVCSHRGFKLLDKPCSLKNLIRCPYHSWSYDLNGKLIATPHIGGLNNHKLENFDKTIYVPAFASWISKNILEIEIKHEKRNFGKTKYSLMNLTLQMAGGAFNARSLYKLRFWHFFVIQLARKNLTFPKYQ